MTTGNCNKLKESASIVLVGYPLNTKDFRKLINDARLLDYEFQEVKPNILNNINLSSEDLNKLIDEIPIVIFSSQKYGLDLLLLQNEKKLSLSIQNFKIEKLASIENVIDILLNFNLSALVQIGFNFLSVYELERTKLKLLNEQIEKLSINNIEVWNKNKTFVLTLPFDFEDHISTYKIQKMLPIEGEKPNKRIYQIDVNQNFNIDRENNLAKNNDVINIIKRLEPLYSNEYKPMCKEFLKLKYEQV